MTMIQPWFDPNSFGAWYGTIAGSGCGILGGLLGTIGGILGPRGIGRRWVLGGFYLAIGIGISQLIFGLYALAAGQPYGIWYGPVLLGIIMSVVPSILLPMFRLRYREAEQRRIEAGALRRS